MMDREPLHLMHDFGRKCDRCGRMTWPGMPGSAPRYTWERSEWESAPDNCLSRTKSGEASFLQSIARETGK